MEFASSYFGETPFGDSPGALGAPGLPDVGPLLLRIGTTETAGAGYLKANSYELDEELNGRDVAHCELYVKDSYGPRTGEPFELRYGNSVLFSGSVDAFDLAFLSEARNDWRIYKLDAVDRNQVADRRRVRETFTNQSAGAIVRAIRQKYLADDGIVDGTIDEGLTVARAVFAYKTPADCFRQLADESGYMWDIEDATGRLNFVARQAVAAPFAITNGVNAVWRSMRATQSRDDYRNVQYVAGGRGITLPQTELKAGDTKTRTWTVQFPLAREPVVLLNGQAQTIGLSGLDTGKQMYWRFDANEVSRDANLPALGPSDVLTIVYEGFFPIMSKRSDPGRIFDRQDVEGGSGVYEALDIDEGLEGEDVVQARGDALLDKYGSIDWVLEFELDRPGLAIGQTVTIDVPELHPDLTDRPMLITALKTRPFAVTRRRYQVTCTTGAPKHSLVDFWARVFDRGTRLSLNTSDIVAEALGFDESFGVSDVLTLTAGTPQPALCGDPAAIIGEMMCG